MALVAHRRMKKRITPVFQGKYAFFHSMKNNFEKIVQVGDRG
jgi:hypothetical protein